MPRFWHRHIRRDVGPQTELLKVLGQVSDHQLRIVERLDAKSLVAVPINENIVKSNTVSGRSVERRRRKRKLNKRAAHAVAPYA